VVRRVRRRHVDYMFLEIMCNFKESAERYNYEPVKLWVGPFLFVGVYKPEDVQVNPNLNLTERRPRE